MLRPAASRRARSLVLLALVVLLRPAPAGAQGRAEIESAHFSIHYDPGLLTAERAEEARDLAERAWEKCARVFGSAPAHKIRLELTVEFAGATGFARPGDLRSPQPARASIIGVRYADLDYLGIGSEYVLTHEVAHIFSGNLAGSALGEGIADWATGIFNGVQMAPWWGPVLREAGLWVDPDALFVTGEYEAPAEVDARTRAAEYAEAALLVRFLVEQFGWNRFAAFAARYAQARHTLRSNRTARQPGGWTPFEKNQAETPAPDPARVRRTFEQGLGESWASLRERWEAQMSADSAPAAPAQRLVLSEEIYGAIRNFEMWMLHRGVRVQESDRDAIRKAFTDANQALAGGDLGRAGERLREARERVRSLQRRGSAAAPVPELRSLNRLSRVRLSLD
jgi:hypothetical protein